MQLKTIILFLLFSTQVFSNELESERPSITVKPNVIESGTIQVESGATLSIYDLDIKKIGTVNANDLLLPTSLFRVGVLSFMELRLGSSLITTTIDFPERDYKSSYFSSYDVSLKIQLFDGGFDFGFITGCELNNANIGRDISSPNPYLVFTAGHGITDSWSLAYNAGIVYGGIDNRTDDGFKEAFWSLLSDFKINDKVTAYVEFDYIIGRWFDYNFIYDNGIRYKVSDNVQLDFSLGTSFLKRFNFYSCGVSWLIK